MNINNIILKPKVTEKSLTEAKKGVFAFDVSINASKYQVKQAVETLFKVHVVSLTSLVRKGKVKRVGKRQKLKTKPNTKCMFITLKKDERIDVFPS